MKTCQPASAPGDDALSDLSLWETVGLSGAGSCVLESCWREPGDEGGGGGASMAGPGVSAGEREGALTSRLPNALGLCIACQYPIRQIVRKSPHLQHQPKSRGRLQGQLGKTDTWLEPTVQSLAHISGMKSSTKTLETFSSGLSAAARPMTSRIAAY